MSAEIKDLEIANKGFPLKNLPQDRLLVLGCRYGKELCVLLDTGKPDSWVQGIKDLLEVFEIERKKCL